MRKKILILLLIFCLVGCSRVQKGEVKEEEKINYKKYYKERATVKGNLYDKKHKKVSKLNNVDLNIEFIDDAYFKVKGLPYFVKYSDLKEEAEARDKRFLTYLPRKNIITKDKLDIYDADKNVVFSIDTSINSDVYIIDGDYLGIIINDDLFFIHKESVLEETKLEGDFATRIPALNYHFFYDKNILKERNECRQTICIEVSNFESHLKYIKNNNVYSLKAKEVDMWLDGKIEIPSKNVLITVDDGQINTDKYLKKYLDANEVHGVLFNITEWSDTNQYRSPYLEVQSHTHNLHAHPGHAVGALKEVFRENMKTSVEFLGGENTAFAFPYYQASASMDEVLRELGFKTAYVGGNYYIRRGLNKYRLPRFVIYDGDSAQKIGRIVNG